MLTSWSRGALITTAVALAAGLGAADASAVSTQTPAAGAQAATARAVSAAAPRSITTRIDMDGDGRADRTVVSAVRTTADHHVFRVTVRTATGRSTSMTVNAPNEGTAFGVRDLWRGAAGVDGVRGGEIILDLASVGDFPDINIYTWRNGRLVAAPRPERTSRDRTARSYWSIADHFLLVRGYTFTTVRGVRHVTVHDLKAVDPGVSYRGTHTTYRWSGGWRKVTTKASGLVKNATAQQRYAGFHGLIYR